MKLKFEYEYTNDFNPSLSFCVSATGKTREELFKKLEKRKNVIALYHFLKNFPGLSEEMKKMIEQKILEIGKINSLRQITFPRRDFLLTCSSIFFQSENVKSFIII